MVELTRNQIFYAANRGRERERAQAWRLANADRVTAKGSQWRKDNVGKLRAIKKAWRDANPDKVREQKRRSYYANHETELARRRAWYDQNKHLVAAWLKANPEYNRYARSLRRFAEKVALPKWADRKAIRAVYGEAVLSSEKTGMIHHVDHIVPLKSDWVCGLHVAWNLQVMPAQENQSKGNRHWPGDARPFLMRL
jgi:hypothetical protein